MHGYCVVCVDGCDVAVDCQAAVCILHLGVKGLRATSRREWLLHTVSVFACLDLPCGWVCGPADQRLRWLVESDM